MVSLQSIIEEDQGLCDKDIRRFTFRKFVSMQLSIDSGAFFFSKLSFLDTPLQNWSFPNRGSPLALLGSETMRVPKFGRPNSETRLNFGTHIRSHGTEQTDNFDSHLM